MEKSKNKSNFCIRPFNSLDLTADGRMRVCCHIDTKLSKFSQKKDYNIKETNVKDWWRSDYLQYIRSSLLANEKLNECSYCHKQEGRGFESLRQQSNYEHKAIFNNDFSNKLELIGKDNLAHPEDVTVSITNLCNLKCQMCSGTSSSKLLIENNALGFEQHRQKDYDINDAQYNDINKIAHHDLRYLRLLGGEPLFNPKVIDLLNLVVENGKAKNIILHITTNGTVCNEKIMDLLRKFKHVRMMFSVDGTEGCNEYIRYPSSWGNVKNNIKTFTTLPGAYFCINTTLQNLNILYVDQLIEFAYQNNIFIQLKEVKHHKNLKITNLPKSVLSKALSKLSTIDKSKLTHTSNVESLISFLRNYLEKNEKLDSDNFSSFLSMVDKRDNYRKISIKDYMPELAEEIYQ